jgi:hypothetical protein
MESSMRIISWAVIFGSAVALFFGAIRPLTQQLGMPSAEFWPAAEIDERQSLGAMLAPVKGSQRACTRSGAEDGAVDTLSGEAEQRGSTTPSDPVLCVESAVARQ